MDFCTRIFSSDNHILLEYILVVNYYFRKFSCEFFGGVMELKDRVKQLADRKKISLPQLEQELGFGNGTIVKWDKSIPKADKLKKVADYFNVSMNYLMGDSLSSSDYKDIARNLNEMMEQLENGTDSPLMYNGQELSETSKALLRNALEYALKETKKENKVKYNPRKGDKIE